MGDKSVSEFNSYQKKSLTARTRWSLARIIIFGIVIGAFAAAGLAIPYRPTRSATEKRDLAAFPEVTFAGLWDGSFFNELETWYADTYPLREAMISAQAGAENVYGIRTQKLLVRDAQTADEIPDDAGEAEVIDVTQIAAEEDAGDAAEAAPWQENAEGEGDLTAQEEESVGEVTGAGAITAKPEAVGTVYIAEGSGFGVYYFIQSSIDKYAAVVNTVQQQLGAEHTVYAIPVPDNFGVMLDRSVQESLSQYEGDAFAYIYKKFNSGVKLVKIYDTLVSHNDEYIYFRTDHHWTALGAYYAYRDFCAVKGITPHELDQFETKTVENFLGSFYGYSNHAPELAANADTILAYIPMGTNKLSLLMQDGTMIPEWPIIQNATDYTVFCAGDRPWEKITNPQIDDGSACVIIKDSYGDCFIPFLVDHYQNVFVIDPRYYEGDLTQMILDENIGDIIMMNNVEFLGADTANSILNMFRFAEHQ